MSDPFPQGLAYDDVLLEPRYSEIVSRSQVHLETRLTRRLTLNIPIISANMDTVTESSMAIALAQIGGVGIIHRFNTIEKHVEEVRRVKRFTNYIIDEPYTMSPDQTVGDYHQLTFDRKVNGFPVVEPTGRLLGIVTRRDIIFQKDSNKKISEVMTPASKLITARTGVTLDEARQLFEQHRVEKLPLVDETMRLCGLITANDLQKSVLFPKSSRDRKGRLLVGAAVGSSGDFLERVEALLHNDVDVLVLDVAHGHSRQAMDAIRAIKEKFPAAELIAGNVATPQGVEDLIRAGADAVKVGVGPGSACTTRIVAGAGVPQLTAVLNCAEAAAKHDVPIIADGGIKIPADVVKALAAGAATVMIGNLFGGTDESPGKIVTKNGKRYKFYRGMASLGANVSRRTLDTSEDDILFENLMVEGTEGLVPYRGKMAEAVGYLLNGLKSGMSYMNARTIGEMKVNARFVCITDNAVKESYPHDLEKM